MTKKQIIEETKKFVIKKMKPVKEESHGWEHVDRVRKWALVIAEKESEVDLFKLEMMAILHDVGRADDVLGRHNVKGESIARKFLKKLKMDEGVIEDICEGVLKHNQKMKNNTNKIIRILKDADTLDLLGAIGIMRGISYYYNLPFYADKKSFEWKSWNDTNISKLIHKKNPPWCRSLVDHMIKDMNLYKNLRTKTAKKIGKQRYNFCKLYLKQLKKEVIDLK